MHIYVYLSIYMYIGLLTPKFRIRRFLSVSGHLQGPTRYPPRAAYTAGVPPFCSQSCSQLGGLCHRNKALTLAHAHTIHHTTRLPYKGAC